MNWTELLKSEIGDVYGATEGLMKKVEGDLSWKPATGENWMSMGQLLLHLTNACGFCCNGFLTGDWGMPADAEMPEGGMLPPATAMPTVESLEQALELLAKDKAMALRAIDAAGEIDLDTKPTPAPWDPRPVNLGHRFMQMVNHLGQHRDQLFYYLKLQGQPVTTHDLYGMT